MLGENRKSYKKSHKSCISASNFFFIVKSDKMLRDDLRVDEISYRVERKQCIKITFESVSRACMYTKTRTSKSR